VLLVVDEAPPLLFSPPEDAPPELELLLVDEAPPPLLPADPVADSPADAPPVPPDFE
jgi:hypothetical protein